MEKTAKGKRLQSVLLNRVGKAVKEFGLIEEGDRICVGLSGGKDSYSLLHLLNELKKRSLVKFEITGLTCHNGSPFFEWQKIEAETAKLRLPFHLEKTEIMDIVKNKLRPGTFACSFCARLRRAALYSAALSLNCNKLALGHHLDDTIETLLMNIFFQGSLKAMPPKLLAENEKIVVIRPLYFVAEKMLKEYSEEKSFALIDCGCYLSCDKLGERREMKKMVDDISSRYPKARQSALTAIKNIEPRYLADKKWHNFNGEAVSPENNDGGSDEN
jgi:tRNA 2-thiocytidine biosynthesis protein TtcA